MYHYCINLLRPLYLSASPRYDPALTGVRDIMAMVTSLGFTPGLVTAEEGLEAAQ